MSERETITCEHCHLVQFRTKADLCRRCHKSTAPPVPEPEPVIVEVPIENGVFPKGTSEDFSRAIQLVLVSRRKVSQRQLAKRMGCPRTYVSKCETGRAGIPGWPALDRFARAFGVPLWALVREIEVMRAMLTAARKEAENDVARLDRDEVAEPEAILEPLESRP